MLEAETRNVAAVAESVQADSASEEPQRKRTVLVLPCTICLLKVQMGTDAHRSLCGPYLSQH